MEQTMEEKKISRVLEEEERKCFDFFWNEVSESKESYGLIRDNDRSEERRVGKECAI